MGNVSIDTTVTLTMSEDSARVVMSLIGSVTRAPVDMNELYGIYDSLTEQYMGSDIAVDAECITLSNVSERPIDWMR